MSNVHRILHNYIMLILVLQRIEYHLHISSFYILSCRGGRRVVVTLKIVNVAFFLYYEKLYMGMQGIKRIMREKMLLNVERGNGV